LSKIQTGFIYHYAFVMLIGIILSLPLLDNLPSYIYCDNRLFFILLFSFIFSYNKLYKVVSLH
jgi:hypothetical protein